MRTLIRFALLGLVLVLGACAATDPLEEDLPDMGDFRLSYNIVVADNMQQVPPSREASGEEWIEALTAEIDRRFGAYEGDRLYHIAIHVDAYALAPPGIPVVVQPRSILVISANVWDDELQAKLHDESEQMTIFEGAAAETFLVGSGLARTREEQMQVLARNAARRVQLWMLQNPDWFSIDEEAAERAQEELAETVSEIEQPVDLSEAAAEAELDANADIEAEAVVAEDEAQGPDTP